MTNSIAYISLVVIFILLNSSLLMIKSQPTNGTSDTTNTTTTTTTTTTPLNNNTTTPIDNTTAINNSTRTASTTAAAAENKQNCDCLNGGTCTDNKCKCASGYYGSRCENILCDLQTSKNDSLSAKQCLNGYCLRNTETNEYTCTCKPSHTGALCDRPVCLDYCYNGGGCDDGLGIEYNFDIDSTLTTNLSCLCPSGNRYYGARCEFDACYESRDKCSKFCWMDNSCNCNCNLDCDNTYCNKVGLCVLDDIGLLACKCIPGYTGKRCTIDKCQGYCFNNGTCLRNETVSCICPSGFNGTRCEYNIQKHVPSSTLPMKRNSTISHLIYGLTITVIICLCIIGVYLLIQKGVFDNLDIMDRIRSLTNRASNRPPSSSSGPSITRTNLFFNKLEDEQNIIQSEING